MDTKQEAPEDILSGVFYSVLTTTLPNPSHRGRGYDALLSEMKKVGGFIGEIPAGMGGGRSLPAGIVQPCGQKVPWSYTPPFSMLTFLVSFCQVKAPLSLSPKGR